MRPFLIDRTVGLHQRERTKKYRDNDADIRTLVVNFNNAGDYDADAVLHHLRALQFRLAKGDMDLWD
jgi:hypothetical protein